MYSLLFILGIFTTTHGLNYRAKGWYDGYKCTKYVDGKCKTKISIYHKGLPPSGESINKIDNIPLSFSFSRATISKNSLLRKLHSRCVKRINMYRDGTLKFSNGENDEDVLKGRKPLIESKVNNRCTNEQAYGTLYRAYGTGGGCTSPHYNSFHCSWKGKASQNSCCSRGHFSWGTYDKALYTMDDIDRIGLELNNCLQTMWDEGFKSGVDGHWKTMKNADYNYVSCGFAISDQGRLLMTQDFTRKLDASWYCIGTDRRYRTKHCPSDKRRCCADSAGNVCKKAHIVEDFNC